MTTTKTTECRYRDCTRKPVKGWTTCPRHYTAGKSVKQDKPKRPNAR